jgi:hypothetical protein
VPPLPFVPGVVKLEVFGHTEGSNFVNIFHVQYSGGPPGSGDLETYHLAIVSALEYPWNHNGGTNTELTGATYTDLSSDIGATYSAILATTGTVGGDVLPGSASVCVSLEISRRYRGGHPRKYLQVGTSATLEGSSAINWQASFLTNVQNDMASLKTAMAEGVLGSVNWLGMCNVSYISGGSRRVTPVVDIVTSVIARERICSQRRRLGKIGG